MLVKESNKEKIETTIKSAEGRATARTIIYRDIVHSLEKLEKSLGIRKKDMLGITADIDYNAQDFPKAYKYRPESTHFKVTKKSGGWDLISVYRDTTRRDGHKFHVTLTEDAKKAIVESKTTF